MGVMKYHSGIIMQGHGELTGHVSHLTGKKEDFNKTHNALSQAWSGGGFDGFSAAHTDLMKAHQELTDVLNQGAAGVLNAHDAAMHTDKGVGQSFQGL